MEGKKPGNMPKKLLAHKAPSVSLYIQHKKNNPGPSRQPKNSMTSKIYLYSTCFLEHVLNNKMPYISKVQY
jgi:hypothetical protein